MGIKLGLGCILLLLTGRIWAQGLYVDSLELPAALVRALPLKSRAESASAPIATLGSKELERVDGVLLTPLFNAVAGVNWQSGNLNTQRITVRGVGSRAQYTTSRVKAYFGGIPISSAEGETVLDAIDLETIGSIEIIKGPNTSSFGAGMGGLISIEPKMANMGESYVKAHNTMGSFGLQRRGLSYGSSDSLQHLHIGFHHQQREGFRENSHFQRQAFHLFGERNLGSGQSLTLLALAVRVKAYIPSSLNESDFLSKPSKAAANWLAAEGFESYDQLILGLSYRKDFGDHWNWNLSVFSQWRQSYEPRPFDILAEDTHNKGLRSVMAYEGHWLGRPIKWAGGIEAMLESYQGSLYRNLYLSQPGQGSVQGVLFGDLLSFRQYLHGFIEGEWTLHPRWKVEAGLALNDTRYRLEDVFNEGDRLDHTFGTVFLPRLAGSFQVSPRQFLWISLGKGFSVPTVSESLLAEGRFNTSLRPEFGKSYELGYKGWALEKTLQWDLSLYSMPVSQLLVARRLAEDQYEGRNAGASLHRGFEYSIQYRWPMASPLVPVMFASGTFARFVFEDFVDGEEDYSGKFLPAIPFSQHTLGLSLYWRSYWRATLTHQYFGKMFVNDANKGTTQPYSLWDVNAGYTFDKIKDLPLEFTLGVNNLSNTQYAASILPNALGFGNQAPRFFYPGPPRHYYLGLRATFFTSSSEKGASRR
jgi:iron complex outermembrane recepter protein